MQYATHLSFKLVQLAWLLNKELWDLQFYEGQLKILRKVFSENSLNSNFQSFAQLPLS